MVIILPRDNKYSFFYDNKNVFFTKLISNLKVVDEIELYLSKFKIDYPNSLKLILQKIVWKKIFQKKNTTSVK